MPREGFYPPTKVYNAKIFFRKLRKAQKKATKKFYKGYSKCRVCGLENNGNVEYKIGNWKWPQGYEHYLIEHNFIPRVSFYYFIMNLDKK